MMRRQSQQGFTLVEMIMVIVITGIIGGMVAVFLKAPVQQYIDVARRADMTDIADTALRRIGRDLRLALPNSVRVTGACGGTGTTCFIEFLPTTGGGRYRSDAGAGVLCAAVAGNKEGDALSFDTADTCFEVLGPMPVAAAGDSVVVYNMTSNPLDPNPNAYVGRNRTAYLSPVGVAALRIAPKLFPFDSPGHRFQIITTPVTYACAPATDAAGNGTGTLTRWQDYAIQATPQPTALPAGGTSSILANNVSGCTFTYDASVVAQRSGLVTMNLGITESGETVTLYSATHVSNVP